jgi:hypothetical protein
VPQIVRKLFRVLYQLAPSGANQALDLNTILCVNSISFQGLGSWFADYRIRRVNVLYTPNARYYGTASNPSGPLVIYWSQDPVSASSGGYILEDSNARLGHPSDPFKYTGNIFAQVAATGSQTVWADVDANLTSAVAGIFGGLVVANYQFDPTSSVSRSTLTIEFDVELRESF